MVPEVLFLNSCHTFRPLGGSKVFGEFAHLNRRMTSRDLFSCPSCRLTARGRWVRVQAEELVSLRYPSSAISFVFAFFLGCSFFWELYEYLLARLHYKKRSFWYVFGDICYFSVVTS